MRLTEFYYQLFALGWFKGGPSTRLRRVSYSCEDDIGEGLENTWTTTGCRVAVNPKPAMVVTTRSWNSAISTWGKAHAAPNGALQKRMFKALLNTLGPKSVPPRGIPRGQLYLLPKKSLTKLLDPAVDPAGPARAGGGGTL
jgi:hypothetical protein